MKCAVVAALVFVSTTLAILPDFTDDMKCPACLLYAQNLHDQILRYQPPGQFQDAPKARRKFLINEDRVDEIIDKAMKASLTEFVWVGVGGNDDKGKPNKAFWPLQDMKRRKLMTPENFKAIDDDMAEGGSRAMKKYLTEEIYGPNDERIDEWITTNYFIDEIGKKFPSDKKAMGALAAKLCTPAPCQPPLKGVDWPIDPTQVKQESPDDPTHVSIQRPDV